MVRTVRVAGVAVGALMLLIGIPRVSTAAVRPPDPAAVLTRRITADLRAHPKVPGEAVAVRAPGIDVAVAGGTADRATGRPLTPETPFRIASVTKTFVAATALRLAEEGRLDLDVPIDTLLDPATTALLAGDGYRTDRITVRMLLAHTAGLFDYAGSAAYDRRNVTDPGHRWTPDEQVRFAVEHGDPLADPGAEFHYADTGYVLAGEIIARVTGAALATAVRTTLDFAALGLEHTWWDGLEEPPPGEPPLAHQYVDRSFDGSTLDPSYDLFGGGGLVSTVGDVTAFFAALFDGRVFADPETLRSMTTVTRAGRSEGAALGLFGARRSGVPCWGHPGYWGTVAWACPDRRLAFTITTNQADEAVIDTGPLERTVVRLATPSGAGV